jgi:hypothetical protein
MFRIRAAAVATICLALALPASTLADSAGDNQYQDPLGNSPSQPKQQPKQTTTPAAPTQTPAPTSTAATSTVPNTTTTPSSGTLPRTGLPVAPLVALGLALIVGGLLIRRLV